MIELETMQEKKQKRGELSFPVDSLHNGIRAVVMGTFIGAGITGFVGGVILIPNAIVIAGIAGLVAATGGAYGIERYLKEHWPSGRKLIADKERIALIKNDKIEAVVDCTQHVNVLAWQFKVKKDSPRAKKGWHLVALGLEQDENYVIVYTAASPDEFQNMPLSESFIRLEPKKDKSNDNNKTKSMSSMREAGEQRRLQSAEFVRSMNGGDTSFEQFSEYIQFLQANYPAWMIS